MTEDLPAEAFGEQLEREGQIGVEKEIGQVLVGKGEQGWWRWTIGYYWWCWTYVLDSQRWLLG